MKTLKQTLSDRYYTYQPGEFLPIYSNQEMLNKREFHAYRIKWILEHRHAALWQFTHFSN